MSRDDDTPALKFFIGTTMGFRELMYVEHFRALGQHPLRDDPSSSKHVFRLTWIPSFHPFAVVKVEGDGSPYHLVGIRGPDAHHHDSDHLPRKTSFTLSNAQRQTFERLFAASDFWKLPTIATPEKMGMDGTSWLLEGFADGRYHVLERWMPEAKGREAGFRELAEWMLLESGVVAASRVIG